MHRMEYPGRYGGTSSSPSREPGQRNDGDSKPEFVNFDNTLRSRDPRDDPKEIGSAAAAGGPGVAAGLDWIIYFREEMDRFAQDNIGRGIRIKYPYVVPSQMKALKPSAYTPQSHIYLGLNSRSNASQEDKNMTRLKANWANNYIRWRMRQGINAKVNVATVDRDNSVTLTPIPETGPGHAHSPEIVPAADVTGTVAAAHHDHSPATHPYEQSTGWDDFVRALDIDVGAAVECYELGFHYVAAQHQKQLKEMLAADALFLVIYLLYLSGDLPEGGFGWLVNDPQFRAANSHYFLQDFFLLENQIPLRVVEAVVQDFCEFRNRGRKGLKLDRKNLMERLVLAVVDRRIKMVFPSSSPNRPSFKIVYEWGSHWQAEATATEPMSKLAIEQGAVAVDIGICDHLLDCLLQAICSPHGPLVKALDHEPRRLLSRLLSKWAQSQGWGFIRPGEFSTIHRIKPRGGHWYDVTKLLPSHRRMRNGPPAHLQREQGEVGPSVWNLKRKEALLDSMTVHVALNDDQAFLRTPPDIQELESMTMKLADSLGIDGANNESANKKLALNAKTPQLGVTDRDLRPTVSHVADSVREHVASPAPSPLPFYAVGAKKQVTSNAEEARISKEETLNQCISELLIAVSEESRANHGQPESKAQLLKHNIRKIREQLVRALRQIDQDLRPSSGLGIDPWERITTYGLTFSYFAETAALLKALDHTCMYSLKDMKLEVISLRPHTDNGVLLEVALEGLVARGYAVTSAVESCDGLSEGATKILSGGKLKKTRAGLFRKSSTQQEPQEADEENLKAESVESATRLKRVGITLGVCDRVEHIKLQMVPTAVLMLPRLTIDDGADSLFRNLSVWERIKMADRVTPFACYTKLLDNLIDTAEDVALMREAGVIIHHLGSDAAVATMVNDLAVGLSFYTSQKWAKMLRQLNVRTKNKGKQYWAEFVDNYFSRPWHTTATLAATFLLLFAAAQTILTAVQL